MNRYFFLILSSVMTSPLTWAMQSESWKLPIGEMSQFFSHQMNSSDGDTGALTSPRACKEFLASQKKIKGRHKGPKSPERMMSPRTSFKHRKKIYKRAFLGTYQNSFVGMDRKQLLSNILSIQNCLSKNQITEFLRTSENLKAEYLYLRNKTNRALQNHLKKVMSHNLSFLDKMGAWSEAFDIQKIDDDNFHMALIQTALEPVFIEQQREYLQFLYEVILPMVRDTPKEVREFFHEMVMASKKALRNMSLSEENLDNDDIDNIAINNFILYIINPLIFDMRINLVRFSHKEIKTLEEKETEFIKRNPNTNILPEQALIEGVIARMNSEKIERIAKTFHDPQRKIKENALTKLLQRTFKPASDFQETDYQDFIGGFYTMLAQKDSEQYQKLQAFKENIKEELLSEFR